MLLGRSIFIVDIEASGLGFCTFPIEIAVINLTGDVSYSALIKPQRDWAHWNWDEMAEQVHNISWKMLQENGLPAERVAKEVWHILAGSELYSDAPQQDLAWLEVLRDVAWPPLPGIRIEHLSKLPILTADFFVDFSDEPREHRAGVDTRHLRQAILSQLRPDEAQALFR